jgi:hypothetical protein
LVTYKLHGFEATIFSDTAIAPFLGRPLQCIVLMLPTKSSAPFFLLPILMSILAASSLFGFGARGKVTDVLDSLSLTRQAVSEYLAWRSIAGLPDGIFSNQKKSQFG